MVSSLLLWRERRVLSTTRMTTEWNSVRLYPIPSIIYLVHNNVQFATLTYVDTSTYQIMGNLKIVTTGILFRCLHCTQLLLVLIYTRYKLMFQLLKTEKKNKKVIWKFVYYVVNCCFMLRLFLKRKLSNLQWMAIVLLAIGTTTSQVMSWNYSYEFKLELVSFLKTMMLVQFLWCTISV